MNASTVSHFLSYYIVSKFTLLFNSCFFCAFGLQPWGQFFTTFFIPKFRSSKHFFLEHNAECNNVANTQENIITLYLSHTTLAHFNINKSERDCRSWFSDLAHFYFPREFNTRFIEKPADIQCAL